MNESAAMPPRLLSIQQGAAQLGVSPKTVARLISRNALPVVRIGRRLLLEADELARFIRMSRAQD